MVPRRGVFSTLRELLFGRYELDPRALDLGENDYLAVTRFGDVTVKCCYKPSSQWGFLTQICSIHEKCPAWHLVMKFEIEQFFGKIDSAALTLDFKSSSQGGRPQHGILVTKDYGSRTKMDKNDAEVNISTSTIGEEGDTLHESITWMVNQASYQSTPLPSWEFWVTLRHDGDDPFIIYPDVSARLQGLGRIWALWPKSPVQPRTVQPEGYQEMELYYDDSTLKPVILQPEETATTPSQTSSFSIGLKMAVDSVGLALSASLFDSQLALQPPESYVTLIEAVIL
ncbi:hypothetical protein N7528_009526 [Penicillium herquei]|nr:hypothetical protein N7528_009526 [Penicillium herquei]